jgi:hypothetical protein
MPKIKKEGVRAGKRWFEFDVHYSSDAEVFYMNIPAEFDTLAKALTDELSEKYSIAMSAGRRSNYGPKVIGTTQSDLVTCAEKFLTYAVEQATVKEKIISYTLSWETTEGGNNSFRSSRSNDTIQLDFKWTVLYQITIGESIFFEREDGTQFNARMDNYYTDRTGSIPWTQEREDRIKDLQERLEKLIVNLKDLLLGPKEEFTNFLDTGTVIKMLQS